MQWQEVSGSWVLIPPQQFGVVHFLGGAFVASAPQVTYRWLLENLAKAGYVVVATPFINTLDHMAIARGVLNRFENLLLKLQLSGKLTSAYLPIYGVGHSLGAKLHLLIGSLFTIERAGNILISFNNYPVRRAIPHVEQLENDLINNIEFTPSPEETKELVIKSYQVRRNLLIRFNNDEIDQTLILNSLLKSRFPEMVVSLKLTGNHLTPLSQELNWSVGEIFTPFDAIGQWVKQGFSQDIQQLKKEMLRWLNPVLT